MITYLSQKKSNFYCIMLTIGLDSKRLSRYGHLLVFGELTRIHSLFAAVALRLPISVIRNLILTQLEKQFCWNIFISISLSRSVHVITEREKKCGTLRMFVCVNEYRQTECRAFSEKEQKKRFQSDTNNVADRPVTLHIWGKFRDIILIYF